MFPEAAISTFFLRRQTLTPAMQARNHAATGGVAKASAPLPARP